MRPMLPDLTALETLAHYVVRFADAAFWRPAVQEICRRHGLAPCAAIYTGFPGTYPTFIVEDRWVVKLFGRLFDGADAYAAERETARILGCARPFDARTTVNEQGYPLNRAHPLPVLLATGTLHQNSSEWPWPYLIYEYLPGVAVREVYDQVSPADWLALARWLGGVIRQVHTTPLDGSALFRPTWDAYLALLTKQRVGCAARHVGWGSLPPHLIAQIDAYLPPVETLLDGPQPHLIHADLTEDHVLGVWEAGAALGGPGGRWTSTGLIDFGDALVGGLGYELVALQLGLFRANRARLAAFLDAYGLAPAARAALPQRALCCALLHRCNVFHGLAAHVVGLDGIATLDELAGCVWGEA